MLLIKVESWKCHASKEFQDVAAEIATNMTNEEKQHQ